MSTRVSKKSLSSRDFFSPSKSSKKPPSHLTPTNFRFDDDPKEPVLILSSPKPKRKSTKIKKSCVEEDGKNKSESKTLVTSSPLQTEKESWMSSEVEKSPSKTDDFDKDSVDELFLRSPMNVDSESDNQGETEIIAPKDYSSDDSDDETITREKLELMSDSALQDLYRSMIQQYESEAQRNETLLDQSYRLTATIDTTRKSIARLEKQKA